MNYRTLTTSELCRIARAEIDKQTQSYIQSGLTPMMDELVSRMEILLNTLDSIKSEVRGDDD